MRILFLSLIFSLLTGDNLRVQQEISGKNFADMAPDQFGNLLVVEGDNLKKLDPKGKQLAAYSNPALGTPTQISAVDALNPILFYRDANVLVTLDNRLNESVRVNLLEAGFYDITLVCASDEERIWLYDQAQDKLFRYNILQGKIEGQSLNLTQLSGTEVKPIQLVSTFNHIYANLPELGIMRFTATGAFEKTIPIKNITAFDVEANTVFFLKDKEIVGFNTQLKSFRTLLTLGKAFEPNRLYVAGKKLYLQSEQLIKVYGEAP